LAGAAGTAIAAVAPFFASALSVAPPAPPRLRILALVLCAIGTSVVALAVPAGLRVLALLGAGAYLLGILALGGAVVHAVTHGSSARNRLVVAGYGAAIAMVGCGVTVAIAYLHTFAPVTAHWGLLKPAHAWLNLIGFVGLSLTATYLHLVPTVVGARIVSGRLPAMAIGALAIGVTLVAIAFTGGWDIVVRGGAVITVMGACAVPVLALRSLRQPGRGRWTTEVEWHRFTTASLMASTIWFAVGVGAAASGVIVYGAQPVAWSIARVGVPLVVGAVLQALVASATHLVPTLVGAEPGARADLGRAAWLRVIAWQLGTASWWIAILLGLDPVLATGGAIVTGGALCAAVLPLLPVLSIARSRPGRQPSA
jgi:nitrite reductase (NO-forming)